MWGTLGIFAKLLYQFNLDPFTITFYRTLIAFSILLVYNYSNDFQIKRHRLPFYALYGFFAVFLFYILYFYTVKISSVSFAVLLLYSAPVYSTILGYALFKEKITKANLWLYILRLLLEKPRYGYEIKNKIKERYGFSPDIVSSYVILYKMKKDKLVEEHEEKNKAAENNKSGKPGRIYYYITDLGKETMSEAKEYICALLNDIFDLC